MIIKKETFRIQSSPDGMKVFPFGVKSLQLLSFHIMDFCPMCASTVFDEDRLYVVKVLLKWQTSIVMQRDGYTIASIMWAQIIVVLCYYPVQHSPCDLLPVMFQNPLSNFLKTLQTIFVRY